MASVDTPERALGSGAGQGSVWQVEDPRAEGRQHAVSDWCEGIPSDAEAAGSHYADRIAEPATARRH
ncbi:hypothetical protein [Streptomyces phaeochromogenes]|uniref:hypothetical protein n=1 Tax=Streptomyces phaeochromogenes TaxID=1923 RepID=UPI002DDBD17E|nr:hypothetical protein [Streptomyces phaeochromogenes]WRZ36623.1 hypothetical protein OG931_45250 [Streptomyces phaeochromogenes]